MDYEYAIRWTCAQCGATHTRALTPNPSGEIIRGNYPQVTLADVVRPRRPRATLLTISEPVDLTCDGSDDRGDRIASRALRGVDQ